MSISNNIIRLNFMTCGMTLINDNVNCPFLDGDVPHTISYGVNIFQPIHFARLSGQVRDINNRNKRLTSEHAETELFGITHCVNHFQGFITIILNFPDIRYNVG